MKNWMIVIGVGAVLVLGSQIVSSEPDLENHSPIVKARIDRVAGEGDCDGLQDEFDTADRNDDLQRIRTGEGNADLMAYIDSKMDEAGCYGR